MKKVLFILSLSLLVLSFNVGYCQWQKTNLSFGGQVNCIGVNGDNIFAGSWGGGVFKSSDNGESWIGKNNGLTNSNFWSLAINGDTIFAGSESEAGIFLSTDNGDNWKAVNNGLNTNNELSILISGTNIFAIPAMAGVYLSTNNGLSWKAVNNGITKSDSMGSTQPTFYTLANKGGDILAGGEGIFVTSNNGASWESLTKAPHYVESIAISGENIFAGTELGMYLSKDNGVNWNAINNGLINQNIRSVAISGTNIFAGTYGGGVYLSTNNGTSWTPINSGLNDFNIFCLAISGENLFAGTNHGIWKYNFGPHVPICYVEFDTTSQKYNNIVWANNLPANLDSVHIYTEVSTNVWNKIGSVSARKSNFIDSLSLPDNQSYSYKIQVEDTNGNLSEFSESQTTITLMVAQNTNGYGFMWTPYLGLTVPNYNLYGIKSNGEISLIVSLAGNKTAYNYTSPNPDFVKYFVGFNTSPCTEKSNHLVKSNYVQGTTGIGENGGLNYLVSIFPNPAKDVITLDFKGYKANENARVELFHISGSLINTFAIESSETEINISDLAEGVYIIKVSNDKGSAVKELVVGSW